MGIHGGASKLSLFGLSFGEGGVRARAGGVRLLEDSTSTPEIGRELNSSGSALGGLRLTTSSSRLGILWRVWSRMVWKVMFLGSSE